MYRGGEADMMDKILKILLVTILAFVITVLVYNALGLVVQDTLINMFLGACIAELAAMGGIKAFKIKHEKYKKSTEDTAND